MKINRINYEAFVLDYLEGNLEENIQQSMNDFLDQNKDIKEEVLGVLNMELPHLDTMTYPDKTSLYRSDRKYLWPILSIAATLLLLVFIGVPLLKTSGDVNQQPNQVAKNNAVEIQGGSSEINNPADANSINTSPEEVLSTTVNKKEVLAIKTDPILSEKELNVGNKVIQKTKVKNETVGEERMAVQLDGYREKLAAEGFEKEVAAAESEFSEKVDADHRLEFMTDEKAREIIQAVASIPVLDVNIDSEYGAPMIDVEALKTEGYEAIASNRSGLKKIYSKIQPEVFDNKSLGSIKEALVPEALADLFSNRTKVD